MVETKVYGFMLFMLFSLLLDTWHCATLVLSLIKFIDYWFNFPFCEYFMLIQVCLVSGLSVLSVCMNEITLRLISCVETLNIDPS